MPWVTIHGAHVLIGEEGKGSLSKVTVRTRLTIDKAQNMMHQRGKHIDLAKGVTTNLKTGHTSYTVHDYNTNTSRVMTTKEIHQSLM